MTAKAVDFCNTVTPQDIWPLHILFTMFIRLQKRMSVTYDNTDNYALP